MLSNLASNLRDLIGRLINFIVLLVFAPDVLTVLAFAAAVYASYLHWGREGAWWATAIMSFALAMANVKKN
jgi:hypothetical protein